MVSKKKNAARNREIGVKLFRVMLIILSAIFVVLVIIAGNIIRREAYVYISTPDDLLREIKNGNYPDAVTDMYDNIALGETSSKNGDYSIPYAIIEYYEAASLYKGYAEVDASSDPDRQAILKETAEHYKTVMQDARTRMGELEFFASEIDDIFMPD